MRRVSILMLCFIFALSWAEACAAAAERPEKVVYALVVEAQLFKNGIAMVTQMFHTDAEGGAYVVQPAPMPIHGTFWFHGDSVTGVRFIKREILEKHGSMSQQMMLEQFTGKRVELLTRDNKTTGGILVRVEERDLAPDVSERQLDKECNWGYGGYNCRATNKNKPKAVPGERYALMKTSSGFQYVAVADIWGVQPEGEDIPIEVTALKPAMIVHTKGAKKGEDVFFSYLTNNLAWAPAYRLDLLDDDMARLAMSGSLKNEFMDMKDTQFHLISGFPNIMFSNVTSLLSPETTLERFFSELSQQPSSRVPATMTQMSVSNSVSFMPYGTDVDAAVDVTKSYSGDFDLFFQDAGRHTAMLGESLFIPVASSKLEYRRQLLWEIPDDRDTYGRMLSSWDSYYKGANDAFGNQLQDDVWDTIWIKNPFNFPMTTAPFSLYDRIGRFIGQTMTYWVSPGEKTSIKVSKALNTRVRLTEQEVPGTRTNEDYLHCECYKVKIQGKLNIKNLRNRTDNIRVVKHFFGRRVEAEENPEITLLPEGAFNVNERNEVVWMLELKPGKTIEVGYSYWTYVVIHC